MYLAPKLQGVKSSKLIRGFHPHDKNVEAAGILGSTNLQNPWCFLMFTWLWVDPPMMGNSYLNKSGVFLLEKKRKQIAIFSSESPEISGWGELEVMESQPHTLSETNRDPHLKIGRPRPNRKGSYSNHPFFRGLCSCSCLRGYSVTIFKPARRLER